ncbi:MAG: YciI family protein [Pseudomonadota bacterium]
MALFIITCMDKPNSIDLRLANRAAHLDYARGWSDRMLVGGPLLSDDGETMIGSALILDVEDRAQVDEFIANDPYGKAGLFESVTVRRYKKVLP